MMQHVDSVSWNQFLRCTIMKTHSACAQWLSCIKAIQQNAFSFFPPQTPQRSWRMCWRSFTVMESFPNTIQSRCVCVHHNSLCHYPSVSCFDLSCLILSVSSSLSDPTPVCAHTNTPSDVVRRTLTSDSCAVISITKVLSHFPPFLDTGCGRDTTSASTLAPDVSRSQLDCRLYRLHQLVQIL